MAIRKSDDIANESDSKFNKSKGTAKLARIQERFDDTTDNDNPYDDAIQYINKKLDEVVDETNKQETASGSYAGDINILKTASSSLATMSGSLSTRVTLNDKKPSFSVNTKVVKHTAAITGMMHQAAASDDVTDTLDIAITITDPNGRNTERIFRINAVG